MIDSPGDPDSGPDVSVRPATASDAEPIGRLQTRAWRRAYAGVLPDEVVAAFDPEVFAASWRAAVSQPPSPRHHVLVACERAEVVGIAAQTPAVDQDCSPATDAELQTLLVDPDALGRGHGSRLLAAAVDTMRADGFRTAVTWLLSGDDQLRAFLVGAGWGADGAHRDLDPDAGGPLLHQVRLHTDLSS